LMRIDLPKGSAYRVEGPACLYVISGCIRVSGGRKMKGERVVVPVARSISVEAVEQSAVDYLGEKEKLEELKGEVIPSEWVKAIEEIRKTGGIVLVLGDVDVGKTFFTTCAGNLLFEGQMEVAVLDGDVGQNDIGPPATVALGKFERPVGLLAELRMMDAYFVGDVSPAGHVPEFLVGMAKLARIGSEISDVLLVNTPGWISGRGRILQILTAEMLEPSLIIALQREDELEGILGFFEKVMRLPVSPHVRTRSREERAEIRRLNFARYFENAKKVELDMRKCRILGRFLGSGNEVEPEGFGGHVMYMESTGDGLLLISERKPGTEEIERMRKFFGRVKWVKAGEEKGLLTGLLGAGGRLLGLGILEKVDFRRRKLVVVSPVGRTQDVVSVRVGTIRIKPDGEEIYTAGEEVL
jgi:polynucleotide 5'-hydroxyl-kinase GRC3/NOL9